MARRRRRGHRGDEVAVKVHELSEGAGYLVRGAQSEAEAREAVRTWVKGRWSEGGWQYDDTDALNIAADRYHVTLGWRRCVPTRDPECTWYLHEAQPGERGAFAGVYLERPI